MPKYFCDYCDTFLTHDSPSVRKTHNGGRKHKDNVRMYYQNWMEQQAQKLVDATAKAFTQNRMIPTQQPMLGNPMGGPMGLPMGMPGRPPMMPQMGMRGPMNFPMMGRPPMRPGMPPPHVLPPMSANATPLTMMRMPPLGGPPR